jgi:hypothetical protein
VSIDIRGLLTPEPLLIDQIQGENALQAKEETGSGNTGAYARRPRLVTIRDLAHMPVDALLLYWFRMNLQLSTAVEKASDRTVKNFTSDLTDGRRFSFLLHRLFPTFFDATVSARTLSLFTAVALDPHVL